MSVLDAVSGKTVQVFPLDEETQSLFFVQHHFQPHKYVIHKRSHVPIMAGHILICQVIPQLMQGGVR